jgi:arylsulfatase A-like enzyme
MTRPNILWITTDQQRHDTVHALGNKHIRTPNLDRLCAEGVAFSQTYCQNPICSPSRASFLTGLYPSSLPANINGNEKLVLPEGVKLITKRLADAGYDCGLSGKLHLASAWSGEEQRIDDGYRYYAYSHAPIQGMGIGNQYTDWLDSVGRLDEVLDLSQFDPVLQRGAAYRGNVPFELHQTTWCCDRAAEFVAEERTRPWLMSVNIFDPHPAYDAPQAYAGRYDPDALPAPPFRETDIALQQRLDRTHPFTSAARPPGRTEQRKKASYYGMIELIDENIGRLLDVLEQSGQRRNTVVIFTSDHGNLLGEHGLGEKGCRFYEGLVRVPLLISCPDRFRTGHREESLVELTDLAPTIAELAGIDAAPAHGRSLLPILTGSDTGGEARPFVRCEFYNTLDPGFGTGGEPLPAFHATMYRAGQYKLCVYHGSTFGELYDLDNDPEELDNLWADPEAAAVKEKLLLESFAETVKAHVPEVERVGRF